MSQQVTCNMFTILLVTWPIISSRPQLLGETFPLKGDEKTSNIITQTNDLWNISVFTLMR
jgi:hypothetical protein